MVTLNKKFTIYVPVTKNENKKTTTTFQAIASGVKGRIVANRVGFDQETGILGVVNTNILVFFTRFRGLKKGGYIVNEKTGEEYNIKGDPGDVGGNGFIFQVEVDVRQK